MKEPRNAVELLQQLVQIPSVNPDLDPAAGGAGEAKCAEFVGELLKQWGAEVSFEEVEPGRPNVIGRFFASGGASRRRVVFAPHTDTVAVNGMSIDPFGGIESNGRVYGRGASDTKGTMAAMLWALKEVSSTVSSGEFPVELVFVGLMGEEAGQPGSKHFAERYHSGVEFAVVGEPTELKTVFAHKSCVWIELSTQGRSCHGSTPEQGENAAEKMLKPLADLLEYLRARLPSFENTVLGLPTVNLGRVRSGSSPNIVPSECRATLDCRETPELVSAGGAVGLIEAFLNENNLDLEVQHPPPSTALLTDPATDGVQRLLRIGSELTTAPWFCDAGWLGAAGIPAVACGPGSIAQAHTADEYLEIEDLIEGVDFYRRFMLSYQEG
ncbi:MAG: M20/M25/M40 family metallo-hydrolase [Verrucomicrobiota bacterium]